MVDEEISNRVQIEHRSAVRLLSLPQSNTNYVEKFVHLFQKNQLFTKASGFKLDGHSNYLERSPYNQASKPNNFLPKSVIWMSLW